MNAQESFINGMRGYRLACTHRDLIDKAPSEENHNLLSRVLRNGIAIIGYSVLEHFIRERTGEILGSFEDVKTPFTELPDKIKNMATKGAISGIANRMKYEDDARTFTQRETKIIASSLDATYTISKYAIGWASSNISEREVTEIFRSFKINNGWESIDKLSARLDIRIPSSKNAFQNAVQRRNDAAHNVRAEVAPVHLESFVKEAFAIATGFDMLITTAYKKIYEYNKDYLRNDNVKITHKNIKMRFIKYDREKWRELRENGRRAIKTEYKEEKLIDMSKNHAKNNNEYLVRYDKEGIPKCWEPS